VVSIPSDISIGSTAVGRGKAAEVGEADRLPAARKARLVRLRGASSEDKYVVSKAIEAYDAQVRKANLTFPLSARRPGHDMHLSICSRSFPVLFSFVLDLRSAATRGAKEPAQHETIS
jgi:hypothetical protein